MVDDYQTQFGEGSTAESASNLNLCHRVRMIQHVICVCMYNNIYKKKFFGNGKYMLFKDERHL